jgi:hypothetical protein
MEKKKKKTMEELLAEKWTEKTRFGQAIVLGRDKERILWDPKTGEIILSYTSK